MIVVSLTTIYATRYIFDTLNYQWNKKNLTTTNVLLITSKTNALVLVTKWHEHKSRTGLSRMHLLNTVLIKSLTYLPFTFYTQVQWASYLTLLVQYFTEVRVNFLTQWVSIHLSTGEITFYQRPQNADLSTAWRFWNHSAALCFLIGMHLPIWSKFLQCEDWRIKVDFKTSFSFQYFFFSVWRSHLQFVQKKTLIQFTVHFILNMCL
jgi:hypothetical protein